MKLIRFFFFSVHFCQIKLLFLNQSQIIMYPSKRSSLSSNKHHNSICSIDLEPSLDSQKIERYIQFIRITIRNHLKDKQYVFQQTELKEIHKLIKTIQQHHIKTQQKNESTIINLRQQMEKIKQTKDEELKSIKSGSDQEILVKQSQFNHKILALNNDFGRKEQAYKEIIEKVMVSMANAQRLHQSNHAKLSGQIQTFQKCLQKILQFNKNNHNLTKGIKQIIQQIELRQQNSIISQKSDEISMDQIDISDKKLGFRLKQQDSGFQLDDVSQACLQKQLQSWLVRLVCFGLFQKQNQQCLRKMISYTSGYQNPTQLLEQNVFPVMVQMLVNNMKKNQQLAMKYLQGPSSSICQAMQQQDSHVELRNINNISDLSINDSQHEQMNFKKKEYF